ncbi:MAG: DUF5667 domain-containing protein [Anaerolineales bacterium]
MSNTPKLDSIVAYCLEQVLNNGESIERVLAQFPQYSEEIRPLLESALWIEQQSHLYDLSSERMSFRKQNLLYQIRNDKKTSISKRWNPFPMPSWKRVYITIFTILLVLVILFGGIGSGVALAAQSSLPGDLLYPVKITLENIPLTVVYDPLQRQQILLKNSQRRLQESETLLLLGRDKDVPKAIELYQSEMQQMVQELPPLSRLKNYPRTIRELHIVQAQLQQNQQQLQRIAQELSPEQYPIMIDAASLTQNVTISVGGLMDNISNPYITITTTSTEIAVTATNPAPTEIKNEVSTAVATEVPPGLLKKTQTNGKPTNQPPQSTVKPSKTARPTATARPANTHKPPALPSPVKPTKKPKP